MEYAVFCVEAVDGVPVDPCGTVGGVAMVPLVAPTAGSQPLDYAQGGEVFAWALSLILVTYWIGVAAGAVMRVIRSA
jgi:hypothetical protein